MRPRHTLLAVLVAAIWGLNFVVIEVGLDAFPPLLFVALRFVVAALPAVFLVGRPCLPWRWVVLIGLPLGAGQFGLLFTGMHLGMPAGLSSIVLQTQAAFTLVFAALMLRERVQHRQVAGLTLAFAGIVLIGSDLGQTAPVAAFALCVGAGAMWGLANVGIRRARPPDIVNLMVWVNVVPPLPLFALSLLLEGPAADAAAIRNLSITGAGALVYLAYLSTLVGWGIWGWLLRHHDAAVLAPYSLLVPVFGMSSAALLLDERFGTLRLVAAVLIVGGVALTSLRLRGRRARRRDPLPVTGLSDRVEAVSLPSGSGTPGGAG